MEIIKSKDNPKVKRLALLHDRKKASKEGVVFIEGTRLCEDAIISGVVPSMIACTEMRYEGVAALLKKHDINCEINVFSDECFVKICSTVNPQGVAMIVDSPKNPETLPYRGDGKDIYVVLEKLQDPGNLGTIIRLADAFDFTAVIMTKGTCDPYNEKVLRSSMGSIWHIPLITYDNSEEIISALKEKGVSLIATELHGDLLNEVKIKLPAAYFVGNEGNGLLESTISSCDTRVKIPMPGKAESLNAASAASIMGYVLASKR